MPQASDERRWSLEELREDLRARLSETSFAHSVRVSETATMVASAYSIHEGAAALAGLLHDWCRDDSDEQLLRQAERLGLPVTTVDRSVPYLLHARVARAELAEKYPWLPEEVLAAVGGHTLGSEHAQDLEKTVYVADMIEPARRYPGVKALRGAVGRVSLDVLYERAYAATLASLAARRLQIHPDTVRAWNGIVSGRQVR